MGSADRRARSFIIHTLLSFRVHPMKVYSSYDGNNNFLLCSLEALTSVCSVLAVDVGDGRGLAHHSGAGVFCLFSAETKGAEPLAASEARHPRPCSPEASPSPSGSMCLPVSTSAMLCHLDGGGQGFAWGCDLRERA